MLDIYSGKIKKGGSNNTFNSNKIEQISKRIEYTTIRSYEKYCHL